MLSSLILIAQIVVPVITQPVPAPAPAIINDDQPTHYSVPPVRK